MISILGDAILYLDEGLAEIQVDLSEFDRDELIGMITKVEGKIEAAIECINDFEEDR